MPPVPWLLPICGLHTRAHFRADIALIPSSYAHGPTTLKNTITTTSSRAAQFIHALTSVPSMRMMPLEWRATRERNRSSS